MHKWEVGIGELVRAAPFSLPALPACVRRAVEEEDAGGVHRDVGYGRKRASRFCRQKLHKLCNCVLTTLFVRDFVEA